MGDEKQQNKSYQSGGGEGGGVLIMEIRVQIEGADNLQQALNRVQTNVAKHVVDAMNTTALVIQNSLKAETKSAKAVNTGTLRNSWQIKRATTQTLTAEVGTNLVPHYAPDVEYGTRPHKPPISALTQWAKRKLHNEAAAYPIARKIARRGTTGRRIFKKSTSGAPAELEKQIAQAAKLIQNEWN